MRKLKNAFLLFAAVSSAIGCDNCVEGEGNRVREFRSVTPFTHINTNISGRVLIKQDTSLADNELAVEAQENVLEILRITSEDSMLTIRFDEFECLEDHKDIIVTIEAPMINRLTMYELGRVETLEKITTESFTMTLNGNAKADLVMDASLITTNMNGSGELTYRGETSRHNIIHRGTGSVRCYEMPAASVTANILGAGSAYVRVSRDLTVKTEGSGHVFYKGFPAVDQSGNGEGDVRNENP